MSEKCATEGNLVVVPTPRPQWKYGMYAGS